MWPYPTPSWACSCCSPVASTPRWRSWASRWPSRSWRCWGSSATSWGVLYPRWGCGANRGLVGAQGEEQGSAFARCAVGPHPAAMPVNHALNGGQANACARELRLVVEASKVREQLLGMLHVEARTVVPDEEHPFTILLPDAEHHAGVVAQGGVLPGVLQHVLQHDPQQVRVALHPAVAVRLELDGPFGLPFVQLAGELLRYAHEIDAGAVELTPVQV